MERTKEEKALGSVTLHDTVKMMRGAHSRLEEPVEEPGDISRGYTLEGWKPEGHWWRHPTGARVWLEYVCERGEVVQRWKSTRPGRGGEHLGPFAAVGVAIMYALCVTTGTTVEEGDEEGDQEGQEGEVHKEGEG